MTNIKVNDIHIEYETFGNSLNPTVLLIAGLGAQLIYWQGEFCAKLAEKGYYVIRFDNRDCGLSTKIDGQTVTELMEKAGALFMGQKTQVPYGFDDMAGDAIALLDSLNIDKAHIIGKSMGGFIAQTLCLNHPSRVLSLTSIFSSTGNHKTFSPTQEVMDVMLSPAPEDREGYVEHMVKLFRITFGTGKPFDKDYHRELAGNSFDRCFCREGVIRHYLAILSQKNRSENLKNITIPTLIIHGDEDPMVPLAGGKATLDAIPNSELKVIEGMGHVMPNMQTYWSEILDLLVSHLKNAKA
jgi:pimeloyl-ACP methyl ester carboxylesterase